MGRSNNARRFMLHDAVLKAVLCYARFRLVRLIFFIPDARVYARIELSGNLSSSDSAQLISLLSLSFAEKVSASTMSPHDCV